MSGWMVTMSALGMFTALGTLARVGCAQEAHSPYAHQGATELKTLSQQEVDDLRNGAGMGLARPAEMNGYPGPRHVMELADSLALSEEQRRAVEEVFDAMQGRARELGSRILDAEKALDAAFAGGQQTEAALATAVAEIARLQGELRTVHLQAHLATRALLTEHQIHEYDRLRGYGSGHDHADG
ncbi:MAG TPA: periplasmic heavy metal sensor [Gemmatimonadota bacterium]|nr:periplasmic heavy metal sensor [Gemmatimonadota bacterium]